MKILLKTMVRDVLGGVLVKTVLMCKLHSQVTLSKAAITQG